MSKNMPNEEQKNEIRAAKEIKTLITQNPELARRRGNIFIGTLNIASKPSRLVKHHLRRHFEKKYSGKYRHARVLFIVDIILLGIIAALFIAALWAFFFRATLSQQIFVKAESSPKELISGERTVFTIYYENKSKENLTNVDLKIGLPPHFEIESSYPAFDKRINSIFIDELPPRAKGQAKISGRFWGDVGKQSRISALLSFVSEKEKKREVKYLGADFPVSASILDLSFEAPEKIVAGQITRITLKYHNTAGKELPPTTIIPSWPNGFAYRGSQPPLINGQWKFNKLAANAEGAITITGKMPASGPNFDFKFSSNFDLNGDLLEQTALIASRSLMEQPLIFYASVEKSPETAALKPGADITVRMAYQNIGKTGLKNVSLGAIIDSPFSEQKLISISDTEEPALANLASGASGALSRSFKLLPRILAGPDLPKDFFLKIKPFARYTLPDGIPVAVDSEGTEVIEKIQTPLDITALGRYWMSQGDQIGRGPMPPSVGETTKYWIFWQLLPTTSALEKITFSAQLPETVGFTGRSNVSIGNPLIWNEATRTVSWTIDRLDSTISTGAAVSGRFEVALTPIFDQVGQIVELVGQSSISAHDAFTDTDISSTAAPISTNLITDKRALGKGVVIK